ncbi:carbohydrate porin [Polaromonas sp. SM01]|uniref:carbohydrate porin n=1 Tax=Polaromonas sp. SM01 TaxID=3085630 RepID=UPI002981D0BD|nr:carbohydrate porin [Polaromonas sp. SM01]MDW5441277.1 carbohydrate porin [Polaromonas sp. SM01]
MKRSLRTLPFCLAALLPLAASAQDAPEAERWNAKLQATYLWQTKPGFPAAYSGVNSLSPRAEKSYSFTSTAYLGLRLAPDTELYVNPELVQGVPMSHLTGLGGLSNAELQKTAGSNPTLYRARLFVRQTWHMGGEGGEREAVASGANQLAGWRDKDRMVLTAGNLAVSDIFDANTYAHDPRTQFMNWSFLTHGAYDFAADSRGYSWGAALEYYRGDWALRAGRFMQPKESNGLALDHAWQRHYGDQYELEKAYSLAGRPGTLKLLYFRNRAIMGGFADALANAGGGVPDIATVRRLRVKQGWGINLEQSLGDNVGLFARLGRNDGASETYAFAEIDRSLSLGVAIQGASWSRAKDTLGLAYARNGLSAPHQAFLAAGGSGFFVGDGRLNYRPEAIVEGYYSLALDTLKNSALSLGLQYIRNPAYNADRGPVKVLSVRLHTEF